MGDQAPSATIARVHEALGHHWRWIPPLVRRYLARFSKGPRPRLRDILQFLQDDPPLRRALQNHAATLQIARWTTDPDRMAPVPAARTWQVRPIETVAALAHWLNLTPGELAWFADPHHRNARLPGIWESTAPPLHHYHYKLLHKPASTPRLIEIPKPRLKQIQRLILRDILNNVPAHPAVHGFRKHRSTATFAAPHVGRPMVLRLDLRDFFPTFRYARIQAFFRTAGYPDAVATLLAGLCTNLAPRSLFARTPPPLSREPLQAAIDLYGRPHLPQGAPTSPALANALCWRLDCRLIGLAKATGSTYTRYADDLAFSWPDSLRASEAERFSSNIAAILLEEGLAPNHRKTRIMRQSVRQHLAGTVVNQRLNVPRPDYDCLKATLHNCVQHGPETQNRDSLPDFKHHLEGRVSYLASIHPARGARLRALFRRIEWPT